MDELYTVGQKKEVDIICITETRCGVVVPDEVLQLPNFTSIRWDRQDGHQHRGVMCTCGTPCPSITGKS